MKAYYADHFVLPLPETHSFPMAKYRRLRELVLADGVVAPGDLLVPPPASREDLALVHEEHYLDEVWQGTLTPEAQRRIGFPWSAGMLERSRRSVGATIAATRVALSDGVCANLAGGTHHAFPGHGEGYCVFNDIAVAARVLQRGGFPGGAGGRPIAIVDCDVHQGNGTAAIFNGDRTVFTFSIHGEKNFPHRKEQSDLDVPLPDGTADEAYLARLDDAMAVVLRQDPAFVFYLSGADAFGGDRLGRLSLTIEGLAARDQLVFDRCAGRPVAVAMGGGYCPDIDTIARIHANTIAAAARHR